MAFGEKRHQVVKSRVRTAAVYLLCALVVWEPLASIALGKALRTEADTPWWLVPFSAAYYWWNYGTDPTVAYWLPICVWGAAAVLVAPVVLAFLSSNQARLRPARERERLPSPVRSASSTFGRADWLSIAEARKLFPGPHPAYGGVVVGEAYRVDQDGCIPLTADGAAPARFDPYDPASWGRGGKAPLLVDPCRTDSTHGTVIAGSGGYKTTAITVPTLTMWTGSAVVFDPPGQVRHLVAGAREAMGHDVRRIAPGDDGINAIGWIDPADPVAENHIVNVLNWIGGDIGDKATGENAEFRLGGRKLLIALLADLIFDPSVPRSDKTLRELHRRAHTPVKQMNSLLQDIASGSHSSLARKHAASLMDMHPKTFSGVYFNAAGEVDFLAIGRNADMLSNGDVDPDAIRGGKLSVFIEIPTTDLDASPALGRVVVAVFQNALRRAEGQGLNGKRVLFLLEETRFLRRLSILADMMTADRKYGATILTFWQSESDMASIWKEQAGVFSANSSWTMYAAIDDKDDTAKSISARAGSYTALARTEGTSSSVHSGVQSGSRNTGRNSGLSEQRVELIRPEEVRTMRADEAIIFRRGAAPLRCGRAIYFRRPELLAQLSADRFCLAAE